MARERDFRQALRDALIATGSFSTVTLTGLPESEMGMAASHLAVAAIQPGTTRLGSGWDAAPDGGRWFSCQLSVVILFRDEDPELCDEQAEQLLNVIRDAVDGRPLVPGFNIPQRTMVAGWHWQPRTAPERRIACTVTYDYIQNGWANADTSP